MIKEEVGTLFTEEKEDRMNSKKKASENRYDKNRNRSIDESRYKGLKKKIVYLSVFFFVVEILKKHHLISKKNLYLTKQRKAKIK